MGFIADFFMAWTSDSRPIVDNHVPMHLPLFKS